MPRSAPDLNNPPRVVTMVSERRSYGRSRCDKSKNEQPIQWGALEVALQSAFQSALDQQLQDLSEALGSLVSGFHNRIDRFEESINKAQPNYQFSPQYYRSPQPISDPSKLSPIEPIITPPVTGDEISDLPKKGVCIMLPDRESGDGYKSLVAMAVPVELSDHESLVKSASTSLNSKVVSQYSTLLVPLVVDAVFSVVDPEKPDLVDLKDIKIVKKLGGTVVETDLSGFEDDDVFDEEDSDIMQELKELEEDNVDSPDGLKSDFDEKNLGNIDEDGFITNNDKEVNWEDRYYSLDIDLNEYNPSGSSTSKTVSCSHQICALGRNCPNPMQQCPYTVNYYSDDTSTSGILVEDVLHLLPGHSDVSNKSVKAPVIIGCGSKQTGGYLSGVAPDGLLGLGLGEISVASLLAKGGFIKNLFSLCFNEDDSGRLPFGDQGIAGQQTTPLLPLDGKNLTYIAGVDVCCTESSCLDNTGFQMLVDSGSSFSYLPEQIFEKVADEFDRQVNASKSTFEGYPWKYCYKCSSSGVPKLPSFTLKFATSKSFVVRNPVFVIYGTQGAVGFCLAVQPTEGYIGTLGQNFMTGYQLVFDRESFKLGWSRSNCKDLNYGDRAPLDPSGNNSSPNSLPTTEQQSAANGHAVAPAVAGRTPSQSSPTSISCLAKLFALLPMKVMSKDSSMSNSEEANKLGSLWGNQEIKTAIVESTGNSNS